MLRPHLLLMTGLARLLPNARHQRVKVATMIIRRYQVFHSTAAPPMGLLLFIGQTLFSRRCRRRLILLMVRLVTRCQSHSQSQSAKTTINALILLQLIRLLTTRSLTTKNPHHDDGEDEDLWSAAENVWATLSEIINKLKQNSEGRKQEGKCGGRCPAYPKPVVNETLAPEAFHAAIAHITAQNLRRSRHAKRDEAAPSSEVLKKTSDAVETATVGLGPMIKRVVQWGMDLPKGLSKRNITPSEDAIAKGCADDGY